MSTAMTASNGAAGKVSVSAGPRGLQLNTLEEMWRFAQAVAKSGLAPKGIEHAEAILVALQMGAEVGLTPMASLQNIAVINGRPAIWGDAMIGVCRASGVFDEGAFEEFTEGTGDTLKAVCVVRRLPNGKPVRREFTMAQAKKAGLWGKSGPWSSYPERMMQMRARSWALRDCFSDFLRGLRIVEEEQDSGYTAPAIVQAAPATTLDDLTARLQSPATIEAEIVTDEPQDDAPFADAPSDLEAFRIKTKEVFDELNGVSDIEIRCEELVATAASSAEADIVQEVASAALARVRGSRGQKSNQKSLVE